MKIRIKGIAFLLLALTMSSCTTKYEKYKCPMECEGQKTYTEPGKSPICGMDLEGVK